MHPTSPPSVLVGRAAEQAALQAALREADPVRPVVVLVAGEAGSGKSVLVRAALAGMPDSLEIAVHEDLQWWSGDDLDRLVDAIAGATPAASARHGDQRTLCSYRPEEVGPLHPLRRARARLRRVADVREVTLGPMPADELRAIVMHQFPGVSEAAATTVVARADGVPFFAVELVRSLAGNPSPGPDKLPDGILDAVMLQADRLDAASRAALEVAAVAGPDVDVPLVEAVCDVLSGTSSGTASAAAGGAASGTAGPGLLDACVEAGFVVLGPDGSVGAFRHRIVRDAVLAGTAPARRRRLHQIVAHVLDDAGAPASEVARHAVDARDDVLASRALLAEGRAHAAAFSHRAAVRALRACLRHRSADRLAVVDLLAESLERIGRHAEALDLLQEVVAGRRAVDADERLAVALDRLAHSAQAQGDWTTSLAARDEAATVWSELGRPERAAIQRLAAAAHLRSAAAFTEAVPLLALAREDAVRAGDDGLLARVDALHGNVLARSGDPAGIEFVRTALDLAVGRGLVAAAAEVYQRLGDCLEHTGDYPGAHQAYAAAADFCLTHGEDAAQQLCRACAGYVIFQRGDWDTAVMIDRGVLGAASSSEHARAAAGSVLGLVLALRGRTSSARRPLVAAAATARRRLLTGPAVLAGWGLAVLADSAGDAARTVIAIRALLDTCEGTQERHYGLPSLQWSVTALVRHAATADVRRIAGRLTALAEAVPDDEAQAAACHACAEVALLDGDIDTALASFGLAEEHAEAAGLPFPLAVVQSRMGAVFAVAGREAEAVRALRAARRVTTSLGANPTTSRVDALLAALGEPAHGAAGVVGGLTGREAEVLAKVAAGLTSRQIAADLVLSIRTIDMHVANAMAKLDCRTRAQAASTYLGLAHSPVGFPMLGDGSRQSRSQS